MTVLFVLLGSLLILRGVGALGVEALATWSAATRYALAVMLVFTASAHFTKMKEDLVRLVPGGVPIITLCFGRLMILSESLLLQRLANEESAPSRSRSGTARLSQRSLHPSEG